jgi:hypothetical protein
MLVVCAPRALPSVDVLFPFGEFGGDGTVKLGALAAVDHAHAAFAELFYDLAMGNSLTNHV